MKDTLHSVLQQPTRVIGATVILTAIALGLLATTFQRDKRPWEESFVVGSGTTAQREWARQVSFGTTSDLSATSNSSSEGSIPDPVYKLTLMYRLSSGAGTGIGILTVALLREMLTLEQKILNTASYKAYCWTLPWPSLNGCFDANTCLALSPATLLNCVIRNQTKSTYDIWSATQDHVNTAVNFVRSPEMIKERPWIQNLWGKSNNTVRALLLHHVLGLPDHPLERNEELEAYDDYMHDTVEPMLIDFQSQMTSKKTGMELLYYGRGLYAQAQLNMLSKDSKWLWVSLLLVTVLALAISTRSPFATISGLLTMLCTTLISMFVIRICGLSIFNSLFIFLLYVLVFVCLTHVLVVEQHWRASAVECSANQGGFVTMDAENIRATRLRYTLDHAFTPVVQSSAVASVAFATRILSELPPEQSSGLLCAIIVLVSCVLSLTFFPGCIVMMEQLWAKRRFCVGRFETTSSSRTDLSARILLRWHLEVYHLRAPIVFLFLVFSLVSILGLNILGQSNETRVNVLPPKNELEIALKWSDSQYLHPANPVEVWLIWGLVVNSRSLPSTWNTKRVPLAQYVSSFASKFHANCEMPYLRACSWIRFDLMKMRLAYEADVCVLEDVRTYLNTLSKAKASSNTSVAIDSSSSSGTCSSDQITGLVLPENKTESDVPLDYALWHLRSNEMVHLFELTYQYNLHFLKADNSSSKPTIGAIALSVRTQLAQSNTNYAQTRQIYSDWERVAEDLRSLTSDNLGLFQTSPQWIHLLTQDALVQSFLLFALAAGIAFIIYTVLVLNIRLTLLYVLGLSGTVMINIVLMLLYGWSCGIIENQAIQCAVPFSSICCLMFVSAYRTYSEIHPSRNRRTQEAMVSVSRPMFTVSIALFIASLFPLTAGSLPYTHKFAVFLMTNMLSNVVLIMMVMPALGFTIGPDGRSGEILGKRKSVLSQVPGVSFFFFVSSGSKINNAIMYCVIQIVDQVKSVLPIATYLMLFSAAVFQMGLSHMGFVIAGLVLVVLGLFLFLEGLKFGLMPMGNSLGQVLPFKLPPWAMQLVAFILGVLVTLAEPAIGALQAIGALVTVDDAPYLYLVLNVWDMLLVFCVGAGVGIACTLGLIRFVRSWRLRPLIFQSLWPPTVLAIIMHFGWKLLRPTIGLAWDCGAVTTGPVTVPLVLALGLGVSQAKRKVKKEAAAREAERRQLESESQSASGMASASAAEEAGKEQQPEMYSNLVMPTKRGKLHRILGRGGKKGKKGKQQQQQEQGKDANLSAVVTAPADGGDGGEGDRANLDGFGVVTLASLYPILTVEIMCIGIALIKKADDIKAAVHLKAESGANVKAWYSKSPVSEVVLALRAVVPLVAFLVFVLKVVLRQPLPEISIMPITGVDDTRPPKPSEGDQNESPTITTTTTTTSTVETTEQQQQQQAEADEEAEERRKTRKTLKRKGSRLKAVTQIGTSAIILGVAILAALIGMMIFNLGLTYGLSDLGQQVGTIVPSAFADIHLDSGDVLPAAYSTGLGRFISLLFAWGLGLLATLAEPALQVLGAQVETLTHGGYSKMMLVWAVAVGVATGVAAGVWKIINGWHLLFMILPSYTIAVILSCTADEALLGVAWDSAGVTTGPVTVPLVLAMGLSFAKAVKSNDGFGILTLASVGPICSVLLLDIIQKTLKKFRSTSGTEKEGSGAGAGTGGSAVLDANESRASPSSGERPATSASASASASGATAGAGVGIDDGADNDEVAINPERQGDDDDNDNGNDNDNDDAEDKEDDDD